MVTANKRRVPNSNGKCRPECRSPVAGLVLLVVVLMSWTRAATAQDDPANLPNEGNPCSIRWFQAHGWLMWLAFGVFLPLGVFASRYGQYHFRQWFWAHISLQVTGVILATIAFIIAAKKFPVSPFTGTHVKLGLAILVLLWLQPLLSIIRPQRGTAIRPVWFTVHWLFGTTAIILGWFNIFKGLDLYVQSWPVGGERKASYVLWGVELAILAFLFLLLDRLPYIRAQAKEPGAVANLGKRTSLDNIYNNKTDASGVDNGRATQRAQV